MSNISNKTSLNYQIITFRKHQLIKAKNAYKGSFKESTGNHRGGLKMIISPAPPALWRIMGSHLGPTFKILKFCEVKKITEINYK